MTSRLSLFSSLLVVALALTPRARAQDLRALADAALEEGRAAEAEGDWERSRAALERSYAAVPADTTLLLLAHAQGASGHLLDAAASYRRFLASMPADDARRAGASSALEALDARIPRVRWAEAPQHASALLLDGVAMSPSVLAAGMPADPGRRALIITGRDGAQCTLSFELREAERRELDAASCGEVLLDRSEQQSADTTSGDARTARDTGVLVGGAVLGTLGVVALAGSWAMLATREQQGERFAASDPSDSDYLVRYAQFDDWEWPPQLLAWGGAALVTAALPLLMDEEDGVPWWSWLVAGGGAVVLATGIGLAASTSSCGLDWPTSDCLGRALQIDRGLLLVPMAVPLLAVPMIFAIRDAVGARIDVSADASGASVRWSGSF